MSGLFPRSTFSLKTNNKSFLLTLYLGERTDITGKTRVALPCGHKHKATTILKQRARQEFVQCPTCFKSYAVKIEITFWKKPEAEDESWKMDRELREKLDKELGI